MNQNLRKTAVPLLRWTLGLVVLFESARFVFSASAAHVLAKAGLPEWIRPALGGGEILATVLFLTPYTSVAGGYALLVIFGLAAAIHILHGQYDIGGLLVYAAAALVCLTYAKVGNGEAENDL